MKTLDLKILVILVFCLVTVSSFAQTWQVDGNNNAQLGGSLAPSIGTNQNRPILFETNSTSRVKVNQTYTSTANQYTINGFGWNPGNPTLHVNTSGYVGIGENTNNLWSNKGPFSLLHLNGNNPSGVYQEIGYRPWMKIGMTVTSNSDLMYLGHRANAFDVTDAVLVWSNDPNTTFPGPDNMLFIFTQGNGLSNDDLTGSNMNGREIMRLTGYGNVGIGPRFTNAPAMQPQSTLHINREDNFETWLQITNQTGTGQTLNDGFRIGITNNNTNDVNIRQQENGNIVLFTNYGANNESERMRITQIGTPGVPQPSGLPTNVTRVSISENGGMPVTEPRSLLHLGRNVGTYAMTPNATDGWREWMDIGMFVSNGSDNAYFGLKNNSATDRFDAVINWGDNQGLAPQQNLGPDNLLFIFTATTTGTSTPPANQFNGVEGMRMTPTNDLVNTGIGGNPGTNPYYLGGINPTWTLEVNSPATTIGPANSGLRFTDLNSTSGTTNNPGNGVLSVDETGRVIYVPGGSGGFQFGDLCSSGPSFSNDLTGDWHVGLNDFNLYFANGPTTGTGINTVLIGEDCGNAPQGKLHVYQNSGTNVSTGIWVENNDAAPLGGGIKGIHCELTQTNSQTHTAGEFLTHGQKLNIAVLGFADGTPNLGGATVNYGGRFISSNGVTNYGASGQVIDFCNPNINTITNYGIWGKSNVTPCSASQAVVNYGGHFEASGGSTDYGVRAEVDGYTNSDWGAYIVGNIYHSGSISGPSDSTLKNDLTPINNTIIKLKQITPYSFIFKQDIPGIKLSPDNQFGFCAQQVKTIFPELVKEALIPAIKDSIGNIIVPERTILTTNETGLIPIIVSAIQEQDGRIDTINSKLDSISAGNITANNGLTKDTKDVIQLGGSLVKATTINLNNKKLIFSDPASAEINTNNITIGSDVGFSSKFGVNNITDKAAGVFFTSFPGYSSGNWGIIAAASGTWGNIGGQFAAENGTSVNYGIFSSGRGGQSNAAGYFDGDLVYTGELYKASDLMLKENIVPISSALNTISQLQPKTFNFKTTEYPDMNLPTGSKFGLIAQEVETIVPGLVKNVVHPATYDSAMNIVNEAFNYKSVDYEGFIPILIQAVKELGQQNSQKDSLLQGMNDRLTQLEAMFTQCCNSNNKTLVNPNGNDITVYEVELENRLAVVLDQNVPNPFAENTVISYFIPDEIKFAQIIFSDNYGKIIKTVDINNSGYGMLKVYAANLSSGIYTYSIIIDGKVVDTKKMVCAK